MSDNRSTAVLKSLPETYVYQAVMLLLLIGTSFALSMGIHRVGLAGFVLLALMSLAYGAVQMAEDVP